MKKGWKIYWMMCGISISLGIICCIAAFSLGFSSGTLFPYRTDSNELTERQNAGNFKEISGLEIDSFAGEVEIYSTDKDVIEVYTEGIGQKRRFHCDVNGKTLKVFTDDGKISWGDTAAGKMQIYIPETMILQEASIDVGAGRLYIENINAIELSIDVGIGEAVVDEYNVKNVEIDCGTGRIEMNTKAAEHEYNYYIDCGIGEVRCGSNHLAGIGGDQVIHNGAEKDMEIDCGIGEVVLNFQGK